MLAFFSDLLFPPEPERCQMCRRDITWRGKECANEFVFHSFETNQSDVPKKLVFCTAFCALAPFVGGRNNPEKLERDIKWLNSPALADNSCTHECRVCRTAKTPRTGIVPLLYPNVWICGRECLDSLIRFSAGDVAIRGYFQLRNYQGKAPSHDMGGKEGKNHDGKCHSCRKDVDHDQFAFIIAGEDCVYCNAQCVANYIMYEHGGANMSAVEADDLGEYGDGCCHDRLSDRENKDVDVDEKKNSMIDQDTDLFCPGCYEGSRSPCMCSESCAATHVICSAGKDAMDGLVAISKLKKLIVGC